MATASPFQARVQSAPPPTPGAPVPPRRWTRLRRWLRPTRRVRTPTVLQLEAAECGAAALAIVLGFYGRHVPLEELRIACGVSRDGSKASNIVKAARAYGMTARGYRKEPAELQAFRLPLIVFWGFNHFVVVEGFSRKAVYLNDPATGPRTVTIEEFDRQFTGVVLVMEPGPEFKKGGTRRDIAGALRRRMARSAPAIGFLVLAGLALVVPGLVIPAFSRVFVDQILVAGQDWIVPLMIGMLATALLRGAMTWVQQYYLLRFRTQLGVTSSSTFLWHVLRLPVEFFAQRFAGDLSTRVQINERIAQLLAGDLATAMLNLVASAFFAALMWQYDAVLTTIGVSMAAVNFLVLRAVIRRLSDDNQRLLAERGTLMGVTMGGLLTIDTIKASGLENDFFARWAGHQARVLNTQQRLSALTQPLSAVPQLLTALSTALILIIGGLRVTEGALTMGMLVAFQSLMSSFLTPVNQLVTLGTTLQTVEGDMNRVDDVLRHPVHRQGSAAHDDADPLVAVADEGARLDGYLTLDKVTFGYSRLEPPLITNLSLSMRPGQRIALVGGSGSGKSTVAKLVAGLYEPWSGEILFDGRPRRDIPRRVLNDSVAMVDQDIFLFEGSIRDNLTLWDTAIADTDVVGAASDAAIHADIAARGNAYDHLVEEGGRNFSGGQRQRFEIARALAGNPSILVLDEATSALDTVTEQAIDEALRRRGCTCLIVAHRLSTIRDCDEIVVLDGGKVVQRGTHEEMIKVTGPYSRLIGSGEYRRERRTSVLDRL